MSFEVTEGSLVLYSFFVSTTLVLHKRNIIGRSVVLSVSQSDIRYFFSSKIFSYLFMHNFMILSYGKFHMLFLIICLLISFIFLSFFLSFFGKWIPVIYFVLVWFIKLLKIGAVFFSFSFFQEMSWPFWGSIWYPVCGFDSWLNLIFWGCLFMGFR